MNKMNIVDYYDLLEVEHTASMNEIKKAFTQKSPLYHPDNNKLAGAVEIFKLINEAQEVLLDRKNRAAFDKEFKARSLPYLKKIFYGALEALGWNNFHNTKLCTILKVLSFLIMWGSSLALLSYFMPFYMFLPIKN